MNPSRGSGATVGRVLALIVAAGLVLRLLFLGAQSLWLDEAFSVVFAQMEWPRFLRLMLVREASALPYYLLLRGWVHVGTSEFALRSLSVIFSVATLPVFYLLGARLFDRRVGLTAAAFLAVNAYHVKYAQEVRGYSLLLFLLTLSTLFFVRGIERPTRHDWIAYVATSALAVYTHFFAAPIIAAQWLSLVFVQPRELPRRALVDSARGLALLLAPVAIFLLVGQYDRVVDQWLPPITLSALYVFVRSLLGARHGPTLLAVVYAAFIAGAAWTAVETWRREGRSIAVWHYALLFSWFLFPLCAVLAVSSVKNLFIDKHYQHLLLPLMLLAAAGLWRIRPTWARAVALGSVVVLSLYGVTRYYGRDKKEDWRGATRTLLAEAKPGDAAMFYPNHLRSPYEHYRQRTTRASAVPEIVFPAGAAVWGGVYPSVWEVLRTLPARHDRVWLILAPSHRDADPQPVQDSLSRYYPVRRARDFTGVHVVLYERR